MKRIAIGIACVCAALAPAVHAQAYGDDRLPPETSYVYPDQPRDNGWRDNHARVLETHPVYAEAGGTHQECYNDQTGHYENHATAGTIIGGIAGGILGHQIGSGRGNTAATIGGALAGGALGNRLGRGHQEDNTRCRTVSDNGDSAVAYDVRYQYRGREYTTRLDHDPGRWLALGRDVRDDGYPFDANVAYQDRTY